MPPPAPTAPLRPPRALRVWAVGAVLVGGLAFVLLVSGSRPTNDFTVGRPHAYTPPTTTSSTSRPPTASAAPDKPGNGSIGVVIEIVIIAAMVLGAVVGLATFIRYLLMVLRLRWGSGADPARAPPGSADFAPPALAAELAGTVDEVLRRIDAGVPRDAIVACWVRLEETAARAGLARTASETATELTERLLRHYEVDPTALRRLAGLYREARFSEHRMTDGDRAAARAALQRVGADLLASARRAATDADRAGAP